MLAWSVLYGGKEQLEGAWCETAWCLAASTCSYCSRIAQSPPTPPSQQISESNSIVHVNCDHTNVSNGTCKQSWMWQFDCFSLSLDFRTGPVYVWRTFGYYFVHDTPLDLTLYIRVSLKKQNIFLGPGHLTPTVSGYEETKKTISNI